MSASTGGSGMKQTDDPLNAVRSTETAGKILFATCLVMAISIYLLNSTLSKQQELLIAKSERHAAHTKMIERLHSFKAKDADLFENLVQASIKNAVRYPDLVQSTYIGQKSKAFLKMPDGRDLSLQTDAYKFGENAAKAFSAQSSPDDRAEEFRSLITAAYRDDTEAALFLNTDVVPRLATIDSRAEWNEIAWWIASGDWFAPNSIGTPSAHGVTFAARFADPQYQDDDRSYVYHILRFAPDLDSADHALLTIWQQSYAEQETTVAQPSASLPMLGLSAPV